MISNKSPFFIILTSGFIIATSNEIFNPHPQTRPQFLTDEREVIEWRGQSLYQYNCESTISNYFFNLQPLYLNAPYICIHSIYSFM